MLGGDLSPPVHSALDSVDISLGSSPLLQAQQAPGPRSGLRAGGVSGLLSWGHPQPKAPSLGWAVEQSCSSGAMSGEVSSRREQGHGTLPWEGMGMGHLYPSRDWSWCSLHSAAPGDGHGHPSELTGPSKGWGLCLVMGSPTGQFAVALGSRDLCIPSLTEHGGKRDEDSREARRCQCLWRCQDLIPALGWHKEQHVQPRGGAGPGAQLVARPTPSDPPACLAWGRPELALGGCPGAWPRR